MPKTVSYSKWYLAPYCIGMKLRALRTRKRLTLARLAAETGLSTALLSKLETDRMIPTLPTLATICRVYGVGISHFFSEPEQHSLSITRRAHLEASGRGADSVRVTPLNVPVSGQQLIAQMLEFPAGGAHNPFDTGTFAASLVYVLEGKLQIDAGGILELLEAGDCACVQSDMALAWSAAGKGSCRILAVMPAPDGDRPTGIKSC